MKMLSKNLLTELEQIIKEDYGLEPLSSETVVLIGDSLVSYFGLLAQINNRSLPKEENKHDRNKKS